MPDVGEFVGEHDSIIQETRVRLKREEMALKAKALHEKIRVSMVKGDYEAEVTLIVDTFREVVLDALSQASMHVRNLHRRYGNDTIERMTDHTSNMIGDCGKKITGLWEEASGISAYDGTPKV